jgi:hypothetical protein
MTTFIFRFKIEHAYIYSLPGSFLEHISKWFMRYVHPLNIGYLHYTYDDRQCQRNFRYIIVYNDYVW